MSHFAKIENNIVTNVIVAEQSYIDTIKGEWIQTSYNTRGGIHYGPDGKPDGGIALRKNYAGVGYTYDRVNDAFYAPRPNILHELDTTTYLWKIKSQYTPLIWISLISTATTLPVGIANKEIIIDTKTIYDSGCILFSDLTSNPGVYKYIKQTGLFSMIPYADISAVAVANEFSTVYRYTNSKWVSEVVTP